jgi:hypothetical protein
LYAHLPQTKLKNEEMSRGRDLMGDKVYNLSTLSCKKFQPEKQFRALSYIQLVKTTFG